jgi:hypothetical protein
MPELHQPGQPIESLVGDPGSVVDIHHHELPLAVRAGIVQPPAVPDLIRIHRIGRNNSSQLRIIESATFGGSNTVFSLQ